MAQTRKDCMELQAVKKGFSGQTEVPNYGVFHERSQEKPNVPNSSSKDGSSVTRSTILLVVGTTCLYSAVNANMSIVSSVASDNGLGFVALLVYAIAQLANSLVGNHCMAMASSRRVLLGAMIALTVYDFLNVYTAWVTLTIAAVFQGIGYSLQWIAGNTYTAELALYSSRLFGTDEQATLVRMFGLFNFAVQGGFVWGNLAVYFILPPPDIPTMNSSRVHNGTIITPKEMGSSDCHMCGPVFRPEYSSLLPQMSSPPPWRLYLLEGVFGILSVIGVIMIACMDHFGQKDLDDRPQMNTCKGFWHPVKQMVLQLKDYRQLLLLPISVVIGMEQAFIMGEYTMSFVSCCLGIHNIGLVMVCFGAVDITVCVIQERVVKAVGRVLVIGFGLVAGMAALLGMLCWQPTPHDRALYYVIAVLWSFFDGILITQVFALYGLLFQDTAEVNYSLGIVCVAVGFLLQFSYSLLFTTGVKTAILFAVVVFSAFCYGSLEYSMRGRKVKLTQNPVVSSISNGKIGSIQNNVP